MNKIKNKRCKKCKKRKNEKNLLKEIITKSVQKDTGATFVRIRNSHEANGPFLQKRTIDKKRKKWKNQKMKKNKKTKKNNPLAVAYFYPADWYSVSI